MSLGGMGAGPPEKRSPPADAVRGGGLPGVGCAEADVALIARPGRGSRRTVLGNGLINRLRADGIPVEALLNDGVGRWSELRPADVVFTGPNFIFPDASHEVVVSAVTWPVLCRFGDPYGDAPIDFAAWSPTSKQVATLKGTGCCGLGEFGRLEDQVRVFADPGNWFRAGRRGVLCIDPAATAAVIADAGVSAVCETRALAFALCRQGLSPSTVFVKGGGRG